MGATAAACAKFFKVNDPEAGRVALAKALQPCAPAFRPLLDTCIAAEAWLFECGEHAAVKASKPPRMTQRQTSI